MDKFTILRHCDHPLRLIRGHYLENFRDLLCDWERSSVLSINNALKQVGRTPLCRSNRRTFRILQAIDRQIDNLKYAGGPNLTNEQVKVNAYRYILSSPYDKRFGELTPDLLCRKLQDSGVSKTDLQVQSYETILRGWNAMTYRLSKTKGDKNYVLLPVKSISLTQDSNGEIRILSGDEILRNRNNEKKRSTSTVNLSPSTEKKTMQTARFPKRSL
ncbi:hypothetical protein [uncultured Alistipes sp.]|uniref:hypothetical protein n=1 Tax=uncultured Alistipes sp. TaxID=538949 RepID=UPI00259B0965|nr:hypothetical protein [uncultured Alistipes sp.]